MRRRLGYPGYLSYIYVFEWFERLKIIKVMFENEIFWKEGFEGKCLGGLMFRSFDLNKFIKKVEEEGTEVIGIKFEGNNLELIIKQ
jgi:hypothetical protein